jgi:c-di-GMP-binding flagellar brake protein YcgR
LRLPTLAPGTPLRISLEGAAEQFNCVLAGIQEQEYLIVRLPLNAGMVWRVDEGSTVTVRLVSSGAAYGFKAGLVGRYSKGTLRFLFLSFPSQVESYNLRTERRIQSYLPSQVAAGRQKLEGVVVDISCSGVKFIHREGEEQELVPINLGDMVELKCALLGMEGIQTISCQVRNLHWDSARLELGLSFRDLDDSISRTIRAYVDTVWDLIETEEVPACPGPS